MLPDTVASFDAQLFGKAVFEFGESQIEAALNPSASEFHNGLMACEIVAASRGFPCVPSGWCYFAEEWLYQSRYVATTDLAARSRSYIRDLIHNKSVNETEAVELQLRLAKNKRRIKWRRPALTLTQARKLVRTFGETVIDGTGFYGASINVQQAIVLIACRQIDSISIGYLEPPDHERINALKILLIGMEQTLESIDVSTMFPPQFKNLDPDPNRILPKCQNQLASLRRLKYFMVRGLVVDDEVVEAICQARSIQAVRSAPSAQSLVTRKSIERLIECTDLQMVDFHSKALTANDGDLLLVHFPNLNLMTIPSTRKQKRQ